MADEHTDRLVEVFSGGFGRTEENASWLAYVEAIDYVLRPLGKGVMDYPDFPELRARFEAGAPAETVAAEIAAQPMAGGDEG